MNYTKIQCINIKQQMKRQSGQINSFSKPPVCTQIIAYIVVVTQFIIFTVCLQANFSSSNTQISLGVVYYLTFTIGLIAWLITSKTNPIDPYLYNKRQHKNSHQSSATLPQEVLLFCQKCKCVVKQTSLHCKICNMCIQQFDHHCIWINNCIGKKNYKCFVVMIVTVNMNFILFLIALGIVWEQGNWGHFLASMIVSWIFSIIIVAFTILITGLVVFHIYLICKGQTTFLFLMRDKLKQISPEGKQQKSLGQKLKSETKKVEASSSMELNNTRLSSYEIDKKPEIIFEQRKSQQSQSQQKSEGQVNEEKPQNNSASSRFETKSEASLKRNKSFDYILGTIPLQVSKQRVQTMYHSLKTNKGKKVSQLTINKT